MQPYVLKRDIYIKRPIAAVFDFFQQPENLEKITPPFLAFKIMTPRPIVMKKDLRIDYTIRVLGIPMGWTSLIAEYEPPYRFVDQQVSGPYKFWHHEHTFREIEEGTLIGDRVEYALPLGPMGRLAHQLFVEKDLRRIFDFREQAIRKIFS